MGETVMALIKVNRLPDRFKVIFQNRKTGERFRTHITKEEFERPDRDEYIEQAYSPGPGYYFWFVPFIETFDTPSGDLEVNCVWEGVRKRVDPIDKRRKDANIIMWKDENGVLQEDAPEKLVVTRNGDTVESVNRKK